MENRVVSGSLYIELDEALVGNEVSRSCQRKLLNSSGLVVGAIYHIIDIGIPNS